MICSASWKASWIDVKLRGTMQRVVAADLALAQWSLTAIRCDKCTTHCFSDRHLPASLYFDTVSTDGDILARILRPPPLPLGGWNMHPGLIAV